MPLLPDPADLRAIAQRLNDHAAATRDRASRLTAALAGTRWHGIAATAFHAVAGSVLGGLRTTAERLDDAADALRQHAARVAAVLEDLVTGARDAARLTEDVWRGGADLVADPGRLPADLGGALADGGRLLGDAGRLLGDGLGLLGIG